MAEEGDSGEKTEDPTARRKNEARSQGQVGSSTDFANVMGVSGAFLALQYVSPYLWRDTILLTKGSFTSPLSTEKITAEIVHQKALEVIFLLLPELLIIMAIAALMGAGTTALQTKFLWSWKLVRPKFSNLKSHKGNQKDLQ